MKLVEPFGGKATKLASLSEYKVWLLLLNIACLCVQTMYVLAYCRVLVLSGSTLNIMFNMFRVVGPPVWIPIKWNVGFLALNAVMVLLLMNEREEAEELGKDPEQVCTLLLYAACTLQCRSFSHRCTYYEEQTGHYVAAVFMH